MEKLMVVTKKSVNAHIRSVLITTSINDVIKNTYDILKILKEYPFENKNQIKYYTLFWNLLLEY
jgi:hypothetical protein